MVTPSYGAWRKSPSVHTRDDGLRVYILDVAERDENRQAYADYASLSSLSPDSLSLSSRSTSSSEKSLHNKRSLSAITPLSVNVEEPASYDDPPSSAVDLRNPNGTPFDDPDMGYGQDPTGSPVDGSGGSSGEHLDDAKPMDGVVQNGMYGYNVLGGGGKAPTSNNFVTKLYRALSASQPEAYADYASLPSLSPDSLSLSSGSSSAYSELEVGTPPDDMCSSLHGHGTSSVMPPYGVSADNVKLAVNSLPYLSFGTPVSHPRAPMDASYAAGQHVQWQLHADQAYDAGSYPNLAALSVNTTSPPPTQQQVQYHQFQYNLPA
ncbi:hypothetical protein EXIGLDRAFT_706747 [Exidia glandulosa HHB12029]|uniref:Uncharacterized protein n=1 Tax=Exidia glandulosa HHB12029 TaxID=1314781 RepID=A0A165B0I4_EXIGL|nr:hypothetical protein EXIGLDRAFT_706747 [Exidia glandulosa HHB12029]